MGWSKRDFIIKAFGELGLASYIFNLTPAQFQDAANRLDAMMAQWNATGIRIGYPISSSPTDYDLDEPTQTQDAACKAIYTNLAIDLAPSYGRTLSPNTMINAKKALDALESFLSMPQPMQMSVIPRGAGNRYRRNYDNFIQPQPQGVTTGLDGPLDLCYDKAEDITSAESTDDAGYVLNQSTQLIEITISPIGDDDVLTALELETLINISGTATNAEGLEIFVTFNGNPIGSAIVASGIWSIDADLSSYYYPGGLGTVSANIDVVTQYRDLEVTPYPYQDEMIAQLNEILLSADPFLPTLARSILMDTLIVDLKTAGLFDAIDLMKIFASYDNGSALNIDWKIPTSQKATVNLGTTGSRVIDEGYAIPSESGADIAAQFSLAGPPYYPVLTQFTQNSGAYMIQMKDASGEGFLLDQRFVQQSALKLIGGDLYAKVNNSSFQTVPGYSGGLDGLWIIQRISSTDYEVWLAGTLIATLTDASVVPSVYHVHGGAGDGAPALAGTVQLMAMGRSLSPSEITDLTNILGTYLTTLSPPPP